MSVTKARCSWLQRILIQRLWEIGRASDVAIGGGGGGEEDGDVYHAAIAEFVAAVALLFL